MKGITDNEMAPVKGADTPDMFKEEVDQEQKEKEQKEKEKLGQELFDKLLSGEPLLEEADLGKDGVFTIKYPVGRDFIAIDRQKARLRGEVAPDRFDNTANTNMEIYATLDVVIIDGPESWKKVSTCLDYPNDDVLGELYRRYLRHFNEVRELIQLARAGEPSGQSEGTDKNEAVGNGAFQNIAYGPKVGKINR